MIVELKIALFLAAAAYGVWSEVNKRREAHKALREQGYEPPSPLPPASERQSKPRHATAQAQATKPQVTKPTPIRVSPQAAPASERPLLHDRQLAAADAAAKAAAKPSPRARRTKHPIIALLRKPANIQNAILLNAILTKPKAFETKF